MRTIRNHQSKEEVDVLQFFEEKKQQEIEISADENKP
jgi:hypothetical protein